MKGLALGQKAITKQVFTSADIAAYNELAHDNGLLFGASEQEEVGQIVPGPLLGGMISFLLGTQLPGRGTNWLKQYFTFSTPGYVGDLITAEVEVIRLRPEKDLVNLQISCANANGESICTGEALVLVSDLENV